MYVCVRVSIYIYMCVSIYRNKHQLLEMEKGILVYIYSKCFG